MLKLRIEIKRENMYKKAKDLGFHTSTSSKLQSRIRCIAK